MSVHSKMAGGLFNIASTHFLEQSSREMCEIRACNNRFMGDPDLSSYSINMSKYVPLEDFWMSLRVGRKKNDYQRAIEAGDIQGKSKPKNSFAFMCELSTGLCLMQNRKTLLETAEAMMKQVTGKWNAEFANAQPGCRAPVEFVHLIDIFEPGNAKYNTGLPVILGMNVGNYAFCSHNVNSRTPCEMEDGGKDIRVGLTYYSDAFGKKGVKTSGVIFDYLDFLDFFSSKTCETWINTVLSDESAKRGINPNEDEDRKGRLKEAANQFKIMTGFLYLQGKKYPDDKIPDYTGNPLTVTNVVVNGHAEGNKGGKGAEREKEGTSENRAEEGPKKNKSMQQQPPPLEPVPAPATTPSAPTNSPAEQQPQEEEEEEEEPIISDNDGVPPISSPSPPPKKKSKQNKKVEEKKKQLAKLFNKE